MLCRRFSKLVDVREVLEWNQCADWKWRCFCARVGVWRNALCREESAQLPTLLSPSTQTSSAGGASSQQPPTAVRSLSPRFLFPDDQRQITPPLRIRDGTRRHDPSSQQEPPDAARRGSCSAKAPNNCAQPAETRRCIGHPGRWCWIWRRTER